MTDSIDKKSKEKRDNLDVDLDAMLDEAGSSLASSNEFEDGEDPIDRLLMDAGFDADDALMQTEPKRNIDAVEDVDLRDELDDLLGFDSFGDDFSEAEKTEEIVLGSGKIAEDSPSALSNEQDDEDAIDRLLRDAAVDIDDSAVQAEAEVGVAFDEPDDFSDFSDFDEPETIPAAEAEESEQASDTGDDLADDDDFFGLSDGFDEADLLQDDEAEVSAPAAADSNQLAAAEAAGQEGDADALDDLAVFSDFSDFDEPETIPEAEADASEQAADTGDALADDDGLFGLGDDFDDADLLQDDEAEVSAPAAADSNQLAAAETAAQEEEADALDDLAGFSDFSDFDGLEAIQEQDAEEPKQAADTDDASADDDGLFGLGDDFDESDMIQDDGIADSATAEERQAAVEEPFGDDDALLGDGFDVEDGLEQAAGKTDGLVGDDDLLADADFPGFGDDFDVSDLIQDEGVDTSADLSASSEEQSNEISDDENSFDSLFTDAGFDAEDGLEQTVEKKDEFGDDADLSEIDNFFQLNEASDDFFAQTEEGQLAEAEKAPDRNDQEDDFLLPDFDITADMEASEKGSDFGVEEDEFADVFGDNGLLSEDEIAQPFKDAAEAIAEAKPKPASVAETAIEDVANVKLSPFEFEEEDIRKQLEEAGNKIKKAKRFGYAAMGFGAVALLAAVGLGLMTYTAKTEVSKLAEAVSTLEASLAKSAANSPSEEIDAMRNSVGQLNRQVDGFITALKGTPQLPVDLLNSNVPNIVAKQDMVSKALDMLQVKIGSLEEKASSTPLVTELLKPDVAHEPEPAKEAVAPVKIETAHEPAKEAVAAHEQLAPTQERAMHETAVSKAETKAELPPEIAPAKVKAQPQSEPKAAAVKPAVPAKPAIPAKAVSKQEPVKEKIPPTPGKWGVNLVAVKQEWYAQKTAAEFAQQGVIAEIVPIQGNNAMMYRLRVGGFKSKAEADSNKAKIQKALNLNDVWVSDN